MTLHADLLAQARLLATKEPRRPKQASLRRAVSTSYYALFHLLVADAVSRLVPGDDRAGLRHSLSRAFDHSAMYRVARQFAARKVSPKLVTGLGGLPLQDRLVRLAAAFVDMQERRHEADYDLGSRLVRAGVLAIVHEVERAFTDWHAVRKSIQADTFLVGLLAFDRMRGREVTQALADHRPSPNASASSS